jgi:hypothetical protein
MSKVSKNQRKVKEVVTKVGLDPRNWQAASLSTWVQFWAETETEALEIARKELQSPKGTAEELKLKYIGKSPLTVAA